MSTKLDKYDKIWEAVSILLLLLNAIVLALSMPGLPNTVAIHFKGNGEPDGFGSKYTLWLIFAIMLPIYALLTWLSINPNLYKKRLTEHNLEEQKRLTSKMARTVKAFVLLAFTMITFFMVRSAQGNYLKDFPYLFIIIFVLIVTPCLYYAVKISKVQSPL